MKKPFTVFGLIQAALMIAAVALISVSSAMAYALDNLVVVILCLSGVAAINLALGFAFRRQNVATDLLMLATTALSTIALCLMLIGRANLMGYVWFSDLESGNPVSVASLYLACSAMGFCLLGILLNVVIGFKKGPSVGVPVS